MEAGAAPTAARASSKLAAKETTSDDEVAQLHRYLCYLRELLVEYVHAEAPSLDGCYDCAEQVTPLPTLHLHTHTHAPCGQW